MAYSQYSHVLQMTKGRNSQMAVCQNLVPLVNIKIAGKWMFIPLKMVLIGIDPYPDVPPSSLWWSRNPLPENLPRELTIVPDSRRQAWPGRCPGAPVPRCRSSEKWLQDLKSCRNYHDLPWFTPNLWLLNSNLWLLNRDNDDKPWDLGEFPRKNLHAKPQALRKLQLCSSAFFQPSCRTKTSAPACSACHQLTHLQRWNPHVSALCWHPKSQWSQLIHQLKPMKHGENMVKSW